MKDTNNNIKKDDLLKRLKDFEDRLNHEKEEKKKVMDNKNKEIENKEKIIMSITNNNKKLLNELEFLKKEVEDKLDKIGMKEIQMKEKELELKKKDKPLEQVIKVKEQELKNAMNMLDLYKRERENFEKIATKTDVNKLYELEDKLKTQEDRNEELEKEIRAYQLLNEEHKKCEKFKEELKKESNILKNEINKIKDKNRELLNKIKTAEDKQTKIHEIMCGLNMKSQNSKLPNINQNNPKYSQIDYIKKNNNDKFFMTQNEKPIILEHSKKLSTSLEQKNFAFEVNEKQKLFDPVHKDKLLQHFSQNDIEKFERKFDILEQSKNNLEKKFKSQTKQYKKKIDDLEERFEYASLMNKETMHKTKIMSFQINEYKNENRLLQKKITELQSNTEKLTHNLYITEEENKSLLKQMEEFNRRVDTSRIFTEKNENETNQNEKEDNARFE